MTNVIDVHPEFSEREAILQDMADDAETDRRRLFARGEKVLALVKHDGNRKAALNDAAQIYGVTSRYCGQLAQVFKVFGWEGFAPDVAWGLYRACAATEKPHYWLGRALQKGWSPRDLTIAYKQETGKELDPDAVGVTLLVKAEGEITVLEDGIHIKTSGTPSTAPSFRQGMSAKVRIEGRPK
jgi:hypothetical protein